MIPVTTKTTTRAAPGGAFRGLTAAAVLAAVSLPASLASAQNALGDGRALDNSLSTRGRYNTARPSLRDELAFRNSVVTGNAPNGLSFRGDVGYRAVGEFTGQLGSNDLFSFRRDSLQSGIAGMGIRGTEALQYQLALTTGATPPANLIGRFSVSRAGTTPDAGNIVSGMNPRQSSGFAQRPAIDPDADDRGTLLWMLRSPSAYMSNSSLQTSSLRQVETNQGVYSLTASPLRGVRLSPIPELTAQRQAAREAAEAAENEPQFGRPKPEDTASPEGSRREAPSISTLHSDLVGRINRDAAERDSEDVFAGGQTLSERMRAMMERLAGVNEQAADEAGTETGRDRSDDGSSDDADGDSSGTRSRAVRFDAETMRILRGDGTPLSRFIDPKAVGRNVYAEHLKAGQELLAEGRYFDAEERFASALGIRRGDVTAQIGRLHAQIGAGLYLSASLNLQSLALSRPEVFAARYASSLLPTEARLEAVISVLEETIDETTTRSRSAGPQVRQASGVLLGYLGYQLERPELIERGMADYRERATRGVGPDEPLPMEARLADLLTQMWTDEGSDG
jgi:hypothetical protein